MAEGSEFGKLGRPGQPLAVWTGVIFLWIVMRVSTQLMAGVDGPKQSGMPFAATDPARPSHLAPVAILVQTAAAFGLSGGQLSQRALEIKGRSFAWQAMAINAPETSNLAFWPKKQSHQNSYIRPASPRPLSALIAPMKVLDETLSSPLPTSLPVEQNLFPAGTAHRKSWQLYAYSFWRFAESNPASIAAGGQYGGNQTGIVATQRIASLGNSNLSLLARAVASPGTSDGRELATGLSLQASRNLGVRLIAEHRLRAKAKDASALYIAGSFDNAPLPGKLLLSGFGQGGMLRVVGAQDRNITVFLDAGLRAERRFLKRKQVNASVGAGAWVGGQRSGERNNSERLDIGPTIRLDAKIAGQPLRLHADWRFRVSGNAEPGNGLALTLSTGF